MLFPLVLQKNMKSCIVFPSILMLTKLNGSTHGTFQILRLSTVEWDFQISNGMSPPSTESTELVYHPPALCKHNQYIVQFFFLTFLFVTQVCDTYPSDLFVPKSVTLPVIVGSSKFRSRGRFPTLSYYCKENHVSLPPSGTFSLQSQHSSAPFNEAVENFILSFICPCLPNTQSSD